MRGERKMKIMKTFVSRISGAALGMGLALGLALSGAAFAAEEGATPHYPLKHPKHAHWSFAGLFGHWDQAQLQRGLLVYKDVCSACHSLNLVAFRNLADLGYNEDQIKAFAAEYEVQDGPNDEGEMFERPAKPHDHFVGPYANVEEAKSANNGAYPPDFSLLTKARAPERGFPTFIFDIFTMYAENGSDYIYSLLTGYSDPPAGVEVPEGGNYNPYFLAGDNLAMAPPLEDELVEYTDGTPMTVDQYAKDVAAFMMWAAEPSLVARKSMGFKVMIFLFIFAGLLFFTKKRIWASVKH
jgi:ubiquinol-cytochrome c reductase cytochrome c1 subunit